MTLEVTGPAQKLLIAKGHQPEFGARPLRRTIQAELDNRIASLLLSGTAEAGDTIVADVEHGTIRCSVRKEDSKEKRDKESGGGDVTSAAGRPEVEDMVHHHKTNQQVEGNPDTGHGRGMPRRPDEDELQARTVRERREAGLPDSSADEHDEAAGTS
jgi:hypothetical protein